MIGSLSLVSCQESVTDQIDWPEITHETKPWTRWWWQGNSVTKAGITAELEAYQKAGLGGLELTPIYGVIGEEDQFIDYLSPEWMEMLVFTLQEAERLGLGIDMANGTGWPFGGPWVTETDACKYMAQKKYQLTEGESLKEAIVFQQESFVRAVPNQVYQLRGIYKEESVTPAVKQVEKRANQKPLKVEDLVEPVANNKDLQALALDQVRFKKMLPLQSLMAYSDQGETLDLKEKVDKNGQLNWKAPKGNWTLYAIFQGWHGKMVERAAPGGEGNVIDHFSTDAIRNYLTRFDSAFAGNDISTLRAFFNDSYEVDDARGQSNWTPKIIEAFQKRHGYDLQQHWPALFGDDTKEKNKRVLSDYRETISDLILETFTSEWGEWARKRGAIVRNQAHGSPANILDLYAASDIPETEGTDILRIKFATSAAHVSGKKLVASESATWLDEHFLSNLSDLKENLDRYLVNGVNHVFYHGTCYSPPGEEWPGRLFYAAIHANPRNPLWQDFPALNQYVTRTQSFLQSGIPDNDVLLYFPAYDRFASPGPEVLEHFDGHGPTLEGTNVETNANLLQKQGYAYDFISDRQIQQLAINNGNLETGGTAYQTLVIPECQYIPLPSFEKLMELAKGGATILVHRALPTSVPGLGNLEERKRQYQAILDQLKPVEIANGMKEAKMGTGVFLIGDNLDQLLVQAKVKKEELVNNGLAYTRRTNENGPFYFITNWSEKTIDGWIPLQTATKAIALYDPLSGTKGFAKTRLSTDGGIEVYLQLSQGSSIILQTFQTASKGTPWTYYEKTGPPISLDDTWNLAFIDGGPEKPEALAGITLSSWTDLPGEAFKNFSGTARYSISFPMPEGDHSGWLLNLGEVHESASVHLNGELIGTLIGPDYQIFIPKELTQESNTLEIEVSNLMANRIADLDRRGVPWKKFYNVNFPARRRENLGKYGLFDTSGWKVLSSGLIGPVTLTPVSIMD
ncbi:MAG: glycosyl hydrolase family 2 [Saprospiraceae bacterium]|nr:MAG: glycosyl hydrolase family 2 [Saprospiraceae bacterium]